MFLLGSDGHVQRDQMTILTVETLEQILNVAADVLSDCEDSMIQRKMKRTE